MIVVDSSAVVDLLVDPGARGTAAARHLAGESLLRAPSLIDSEVASVLLRLERSGTLPEDKTIRAVTDYRTLPLRRYDHLPLLEHVRQLGSVRTYDAIPVALAEGLGAPLLTSGARLARAPGPRCRVISLHDGT